MPRGYEKIFPSSKKAGPPLPLLLCLIQRHVTKHFCNPTVQYTHRDRRFILQYEFTFQPLPLLLWKKLNLYNNTCWKKPQKQKIGYALEWKNISQIQRKKIIESIIPWPTQKNSKIRPLTAYKILGICPTEFWHCSLKEFWLVIFCKILFL